MIRANRLYRNGFRQVKKTQDWSIGNEVRVGFLTLRVTGSDAVKDGLPDIYTLESLDGSKKYEFIPHNGLTRTN